MRGAALTIVWVLLLVLLALIRTPLFVVLFFATMLVYSHAEIDLINIFVVMSDLLEKPYLLPIPLFTLAGFILAASEAPQRIVRFAKAVFGWMPGGLAVLSVGTCAFLTTFTGASGVTIIALGGMLYPLLRKSAYPEEILAGPAHRVGEPRACSSFRPCPSSSTSPSTAWPRTDRFPSALCASSWRGCFPGC